MRAYHDDERARGEHDAVDARGKDLAELVTIEMGKIRDEGEGEVQEMIDMGDFAVGQSRMLYGLSMHSERPAHRMYEQCRIPRSFVIHFYQRSAGD